MGYQGHSIIQQFDATDHIDTPNLAAGITGMNGKLFAASGSSGISPNLSGWDTLVRRSTHDGVYMKIMLRSVNSGSGNVNVSVAGNPFTGRANGTTGTVYGHLDIWTDENADITIATLHLDCNGTVWDETIEFSGALNSSAGFTLYFNNTYTTPYADNHQALILGGG